MKKEIFILLSVFLSAHARAQLIGSFASGDFDKGDKHVYYRNCIGCKEFLIDYIPNTVGYTGMFAEEKSKFLDSVCRAHIAKNGNRVRSTLPGINYDSAGVQFFVQGLTPAKAPDFEYRVLEDDQRELVPWSPVTRFVETEFDATYPTDPEMASLGTFKTGWGHYLSVDVRKKGSDTIITTSTVVWKETSPVILGVFSNKSLNDFLTVFKKQWQHEFVTSSTSEERKKKDSLLLLRNDFLSGDNNLIFYLDNKIASKEIVEYKLTGPGGTTPWKPNDFDFNFIWLKDLPPGKYMLQVRFSVQRHKVTDYPFEIRPAWHQTAAFKIISGSLITAFFAFIFVLFRLWRQQQKLLAVELKNARTESRLGMIRSQLNPHFVFNALNSIQGLMNKKDIPAANKYLARFGHLVRDSLMGKNADSVSLDQEIHLLDTYLQLEQLRFNFRYKIETDPDLPIFETEIPSLLLQPLVENAVKHGVSTLYENGEIGLLFKKQGKDMVAELSDNGPGFDFAPPFEGYGFRLTTERISLFNELSGDRTIYFQVNSDPGKGTHVLVIFKNCL